MAHISVLVLVLVLVAAQALGSCVFNVPFYLKEQGGRACYQFDLSAMAAEAQTYVRQDTYPDTYLIQSPCGVVPLPDARCKDDTACPALQPSPFYQLYRQNGGCISCGDPSTLTALPLNASDPSAGVRLSFSNGSVCPGDSTPRTSGIYLRCNHSASPTQGPDALVGITPSVPDQYGITWQTPLSCAPTRVPLDKCSFPPIATPTLAQLDWQKLEIGVIIHMNMATAAGTQGCGIDSPPPPSLFNPTAPNFTAQWAQSMVDLGAKYAVYVAKHGCGFTTWPTKVSFPDFNFTYNYSVAQSPYHEDLVGNFVRDARAHGVRVGFYYSVVSNAYLLVSGGTVQPGPIGPMQVKVTQEQYERIVLAQLTELWTNYGELEEIWFDGGYQTSLKSNLTAMLARLQPAAVAFNGFGVAPNPVRWCGTESGSPDYPNWSTGHADGGGDPNSPDWCPAEVDTTLQNQDAWFYNPTVGLRALAELKTVYHNSVGRNGNLLLDFAPMPNGLLPDDAVQRYKEFGDWIRTCYTAPVAAASGSGDTFVLKFDSPRSVDRIVIQEDQYFGELVRAYTVSALVDGNWKQVTSGSSVGNKRIDVWPSGAVTTTSVQLVISEWVDLPQLAFVGVYDPQHC